ncbi:hypothetical protein EYF80_052841 [Liparis tanakae]|uniref:Uncharacterized protein n=1 Tax=Liparis tanakae TaxID=230148 RepID=A0A4Z2F773_9TELE|nr:hypothetical protein EYF80_052841 [Liparis tanakae]
MSGDINLQDGSRANIKHKYAERTEEPPHRTSSPKPIAVCQLMSQQNDHGEASLSPMDVFLVFPLCSSACQRQARLDRVKLDSWQV